MKTIGVIGGMSWESSAEYYALINRGVQAALGGLHSAQIVLFSVDFAPIEHLQTQGRWDEAGDVLSDAARCLERSGADLILIGTNTMHRVADRVAQAVGVPLIHIADAIGGEAARLGMNRLGLMGTRFTMEQDFLKDALHDRFGCAVIIPDENQRAEIHRVIYEELCLGKILEPSRRRMIRIVQDLADRGAQGIVLGCTELPLLIRSSDCAIPLLNTTALHAARAVELALGASAKGET